MRNLLVAATMLAMIAGGAVAARERNRPLAANPSGFIAAEIAFSRLAQEKGQWTAFRETAAPEAVMPSMFARSVTALMKSSRALGA